MLLQCRWMLTCMLAPRARSSELDAELRLALQWWLEVLEGDMVEVRPWRKQRKRPIHMFSDARGEPPRVAAVIFV